MKKESILVCILLFYTAIIYSQVSINKDGSAPNAYSILHVKGDATNKNILFETGTSGKVGIDTETPDYKFTIQSGNDNNTLRLIGIEGIHGYGAKLSFGDGHYAEIREDGDDSLTIYSGDRTSILGGNVGIGTKNPTVKLEVVGQVKITGGSPSEGKVLTSDANGLASWQTQALDVGNYGVVTNPVTGKRWLDRNLGASHVATSNSDALGDLYQWGRAQDGHEDKNSTTYSGQATTWFADEGSNTWDTKFIIGSSEWLNTVNNDLWKGTDAENNPCPSGFRIPTNAEWNQERQTWSTQDASGAFNSVLHLPLGGFRSHEDGSLINIAWSGWYWSSTVDDNNARYLTFGIYSASLEAIDRARGFSIRCIED